MFFFLKDVRWVTVLQGHKLVFGCQILRALKKQNLEH